MIDTLKQQTELRQIPATALQTSLNSQFNDLARLFSDALFAAYLLGYDYSREEHAPRIKQARKTQKTTQNSKNIEFANYIKIFNFADGNDDKLAEKAGLLELRFDVKPEEAIDYFKRKKVLPSKTFYDLRDEARQAAFTVSGVYQKDVLEAFRAEIEDALDKGTSQSEVINNFKSILTGDDPAFEPALGDFHLETVFRTNMQTAYGVGRRSQMEEVSDLLRFWEYSAVADDRTRPTHRALDGVILPADHPFWSEHYPPWGFNCRCAVIATFEPPAGYDPAKPNPDTTIVYDENGSPAKAEYGTNVYDLSAGKFTGIPKQNAGLRETIETAAAEANQQRRRKTPRAVLRWEERVRNDRAEAAYIFDQAGKLQWQKQGTRDRVRFTLTEKEQVRLKGGILTHNHPANEGYDSAHPFADGGDFSPADIYTAAVYGLSEVRAVSQKYRFSARPKTETWDARVTEVVELEADEFYTRLHEQFGIVFAEIFNELTLRVQQKTFANQAKLDVALAKAEVEARHRTWKRLAEEFGFIYKRDGN